MSQITVAQTQTLLAQTLTLIQAQVESPAQISIEITGSGGSLAGGSLVIVGKDANGAENEEIISPLDVGTFISTATFSYVTSITPDGEADFTGYFASATYEGTGPFNCDCTDENPNQTLAELRRRMLVRLGYSAQADNPPPGMVDLLDDFLINAQRLLYRRYNALRTERFFSWTMVPGARFYDLDTNRDNCTKRMDAYKVSWVGIEDLNGVWYDLFEGIPPEFYTSSNFEGIPSRYEIRQCIEVFPAPAQAYTLRIKAHFGLEAFADDEDQTTIDSELVFLWALANAKAHYGQPDANNIAAQANTYRGDLIAGSHLTARYVPGTSPAQPWVPPHLITFEN